MEELQRVHDIMTIIEERSDQIAARVRIDGKWQNLFLSEMPGDIAIREAFKFIRRGTIPLFMPRPEFPDE